MRPHLLLTAMLASLLLCAIAAATLTRAAIDYQRSHPPASPLGGAPAPT